MLPELPEPPAIMPPPASWAAAGAVCVWLVSCSTVSVVSPTVPEIPGRHPQPHVCRHSDADHIMPGIVRRQAVGGLGADTGQAVRVRLRTAGCTCYLRARFIRSISIGGAVSSLSVGRPHIRMLMTGQLLHTQRRGADSAGNTRPPPSTPRLPGLRRGSHNAPHSTAAGCWQPRNWHRTGCACATETPLSG